MAARRAQVVQEQPGAGGDLRRKDLMIICGVVYRRWSFVMVAHRVGLATAGRLSCVTGPTRQGLHGSGPGTRRRRRAR
jgi:hypothetical protein